MGDFLLGGERSGTPVETRGATKEFAGFLQNWLKSAGSDPTKMLEPFQQLSMDALMALLTVPEVAQALISPADRTRGLFSAMEPFEAAETGRQVAGNRSIFGSVGGRFSRNVAEAEALTRGELANQFTRARQEALLGAEGQRMSFLAQLIQAATQQAQTGASIFNTTAGFLAPGAPQYQPGILPGLLSAASGIYSGQMINKALQAGGGGARSIFQGYSPPVINAPPPLRLTGVR